MEENYLILLSAFLIVLIASLINHYDLSIINEGKLTGEFCKDYSMLFLGCWCAKGDIKLADFGLNVSNALMAKELLVSYCKETNKSCNDASCVDLRKGFYNCYCEEELIGAISVSGEFYKTECSI